MAKSNPKAFRSQVNYFLKKVRKSQAKLAREINMDASELNRQLGGNNPKSRLSDYSMVKILKTLIEWKAINSQKEVEDLVSLIEFADTSTPLFDWNEPPFTSLAGLSGATQTATRGGATTPTEKASLPLPNSGVTPPFSPDLNSGQGNPLSVVVQTSNNVNVDTDAIIFGNIAPRRECPLPPAPPDYFGGRDKELTKLKNQVRSGGAEVISLTTIKGLGGIGKTTIARKLAHDLFHNEPEKVFKAVFWREIKRKPDPVKATLDWAYLADPAFFFRGNDTARLATQVRTLLTTLVNETCTNSKLNRVLVVFDDVWDDGVETVRLLKTACPANATVLITTRSGKAAGLLSNKIVQLDKLEPDKGVELLKQYLPDEDEAALYKLAQVLDGHALALTIAARRLLMEPNKKRAKLLDAQITRYEEELPKGTPFANLEFELTEDKEDNLTKALYFSYEELDEQEQAFFRSLGILPYNAPFNEKLLEAIWEVDGQKVKEICQRLRLLSLIDEDDSDENKQDGPWYRQHPLVQSYARALFNRAGDQ